MATLAEAVKMFVDHTGRTDLLLVSEATSFVAETNLITNEEMTGTYTAGVAPNWTTTGSQITPTEASGVDNAYGNIGSSQKITITSAAANNFLASNTFSVTAGKTYRIRFALKMTSGVMGAVMIVDSTLGTTLRTLYDYQQSINLSAIDQTLTSFAEYTFDFVAPATTSNAKLYFFNRFNSPGVYTVDHVKVAELTGGTDARAYIREACEFLDQQQEHPQQFATHVEDLTEGDYLVDLKYCRAVNNVYLLQSGEERAKLERATMGYILENYTDRLADTETGTPEFFAIVDPRQAPDQAGDALNAVDAEWLIIADAERTTRLVLMPPVDGAYTVVVEGLFSSALLPRDHSTNWWLTNKPMLVVWVAKFIVEGALRSASGMSDLMAFIQPYLTGIDKDLVELYMPDCMEMEG